MGEREKSFCGRWYRRSNSMNKLLHFKNASIKEHIRNLLGMILDGEEKITETELISTPSYGKKLHPEWNKYNFEV